MITLVRKTRLVAFTPEVGRRIKKNAGNTPTSIIPFDTKPRGGGGGGESKFFRYTLSAHMGSSTTTWIGAATASLTAMGNSNPSIVVIVHDVLGIASWQVAGQKGICVLAGNEYFILTPQCEPDTP